MAVFSFPTSVVAMSSAFEREKALHVFWMSIVTSRKYRDANGATREQTDWHNVVAWGKSADILEQLDVRKGTTLYVEGSISYRSWDDQNGQKRYATDINLDTFQILTPRNGGQGTAAASGSAPRAQAAPAQTGGGFADSDDLPF